MRHATRRLRSATPLLLALGAAALTLGGCVSSGEYENTAESTRALQIRNQELAQEVASLRDALEQRDGADNDLREQNDRLRQERAALTGDIENLQDQINATNTALGDIRFSSLDPATDAALRRLASRYSDLMSYDPATGRIIFASDLTFPSGSDTVRDSAKQGLNEFARILRTSDAGNYLIYIEGHTDAQIPKNPATVAKHPTNRHLSAHRAIAVGNVLKAQGIAAGRIFTGGWGAERPLVANNANGNTPANRRVEIFLVADPGTSTAAPPSRNASTDGSDETPARTRPDAPMK